MEIENPEFTMRVDLHAHTKYLIIKEMNGDKPNIILNQSEI